MSALSATEQQEMAVSMAALLCSDAEKDVSADNLNAVLKAAGVKVESFWVPAFVKFFEKAESVTALANATAGPGSGGGGGGGGGGAAAADAAPAEEPEKSESEVDMGGGMVMFGGEPAGGGDY